MKEKEIKDLKDKVKNNSIEDMKVNYKDIIVMIEVTMMNMHAQKRSEWEPVLRHSVNLRAESLPKDTVTLFIANELDYNTINIWRAVAMVPLESSNSTTKVKDVHIIPLTTLELLDMLSNNVGSNKLISEIKDSYSSIKYDFDDDWRNTLLENVNN